ncbi:MAG: DNA primase DnaG [Pyrodictiaceae archaeon]
MKYLIKARVEVDGLVDKHDIIGAIFGQTENLFGEDFDLRELQDRGRLGRIIVEVKHEGSKTKGEIQIPSNLDRIETALIAAMIEHVDRVGPYKSSIRVVDIIDIRAEKIRKIIERAKEILRIWSLEKTPDLKEVLREISEATKKPELIEYGPEKLPAGPDIEKSDEIIIVEGRADVINLLRYGYRNVIALEGARGKVPETIIKLSKEKKTIAFVDGDHGGDLILLELLRSADIDYVARAPPGKEVEELTGKEIAKALKSLIPAKQYREILEKKFGIKEKHGIEEKPVEVKPPEEKPSEVQVEAVSIEIPKEVVDKMRELQGTLEAIVYDKSWKPIIQVPVKDVYEALEKIEPGKAHAVVYDGIITQRMLDIAAEKEIKLLVAAKLGNIERRPKEVIMLTFNDVLA